MILFLTTLGVYLGLVLVGATPQVLAQAATAKQFSVKDEVEVKDDLDKNPKRSDSVSIDLLLENIESSFSALVSSLHDCKSFPAAYSSDGRWKHGDCGFSVDNATTTQTGNKFAAAALAVIGRFDAGVLKDLSDDRSTPYVGCDLYSRGIKLSLVLSQVDDDRAATLAQLLQGRISSRAVRSQTYLRESIYENSRVSALGNQVLITTRLPRGSLDSLLATDAK